MSTESANRYKLAGNQITSKYIADQLAWEPVQQTKIKDTNQEYKNCGRPPIPYAQLISQAIENAPSRKVTLSGIYQYVMTYYPYFKTAGSGWKNSVRHNLSLNKSFVRVPRPPLEKGKGAYWTKSDEATDTKKSQRRSHRDSPYFSDSFHEPKSSHSELLDAFSYTKDVFDCKPANYGQPYADARQQLSSTSMATLLDGENEQNLGKYTFDEKQGNQLYFEPTSYFQHQTSMEDLGVSQQISESNLSNASFMTVNQNIDQNNFINNSAFQSMEFPSSSSVENSEQYERGMYPIFNHDQFSFQDFSSSFNCPQSYMSDYNSQYPSSLDDPNHSMLLSENWPEGSEAAIEWEGLNEESQTNQ
ncbi:Forkhead box protein K1 [Boothiomyces macroporosus]|uniref:Forkhead box protein K1 n=1 Tax=Boothiomyces macroporosus TaxID=261099 RepID=A0AAD5UHM0_9FUNG|nr:Forkhead box protein K1 [Boothiomyces macroporosus]